MSTGTNTSAQQTNPNRSESGQDGRRGKDRRQKPTPVLSRYWLFGRRRTGRRGGEDQNVYVDRYTRSEWVLVLGILVLSMLDMVFTLLHLDAGGTEANPIMAWTLAWGGRTAFRYVKVTTTLLGLFVLLLHARFHRVRSLLTFAFILYAAVLLFHFYLAHMRAVAAM